MKLRQNEYCHNCSKYVDFEFDDITEKQVIICPSCGHEHWRELDMGTLVSIRATQGVRFIYRPKPIALSCVLCSEGSVPVDKIVFEVEKLEVVGHSANGDVIVKDPNGKSPTITNRRWGRDRRQG